MKQNTGIMKRFLLVWISLCCAACTQHYTPKPRGYMRLEPPAPHYRLFALENLPYSFHISHLAEIELPPENANEGWINIAYPSLGAKIYGSYLPVTPSTLPEAEADSRELVVRQARHAERISEKAYTDPEKRVYGSLFLLDGEAASPIQFTLTDSSSHFFRGSLFYEARLNADSLAPVTRYLQEDIQEIIQSFSWND